MDSKQNTDARAEVFVLFVSFVVLSDILLLLYSKRLRRSDIARFAQLRSVHYGNIFCSVRNAEIRSITRR